MLKKTVTWWVGLALGMLAGCGDSPELRIEQAQLALTHGRPDQALSMVAGVLVEKPGDQRAMLLQAQAQLALAQLDDSKKTLDQLLEAHRDHVDVRVGLVRWSWARLEHLLGQQGFSTSVELAASFDQTLAVGQTHARWLIEQRVRPADGHYFLARCASYDADRWRAVKPDDYRLLRGHGVSEDDPGHLDVAIGRLGDRIDRCLAQATEHLQQAIGIDPGHDRSLGMQAKLLVQQERWPQLWVLSEQLKNMKNLSALTARQWVWALLDMPSTQQPVTQRIQVCWQIHRNVKPAEQDRWSWKITAARLHLAGGQPAKAKPLLDEVLRTHPDSNEAQRLMAQSLYGLGRYGQAKRVLAKLSSRLPHSSQIQTLYGLVLIQTGEKDLAKTVLRRATELNPLDTQAAEAFLALMAQEGLIEQAQADVDGYIRQHPTDPRAIRFKMRFEHARGRVAAVAELLEQVERFSPRTDEHRHILIDGYAMLRRYPKAQAHAQEGVRQNPDSLDNHLQLAKVLLMQGKDDQVKQVLVRLRARFPDTANINAVLGALYLQRQSFDRAIPLLETAIGQEPSNVRWRVMLAQAMASLSRVEEALQQIDLALEQDPQDVGTRVLAVQINQFAGRHEEADRHLAQIDPGRVNQDTYPALLAQLKIKNGQIDQAMAVCNRAIALGHADPVLRLIAAGICLKNNEPGQAENHMLALVRSQPNNWQAYALLGRFYLEQDNLDKGLVEMGNLQMVHEPFARMGQASMLATVGRWDEALDRLEPVYESLVGSRSPVAVAVADALAKIHVRRGDPIAAGVVFDAMIRAGFDADEARLRQIDLKMLGPAPQQLVGQLDALADTLKASNQRLRNQVIDRYRILRRYDRALEAVDHWMANQPDEPALWRLRGQLLLDADRPEDAVVAFWKAVSLSGESVGLRLRLAQAYTACFDFPNAQRVLLDAAKLNDGAKIAALTALGQMYLTLGLGHQAEETFEELDRFGFPKDPQVAYAVGKAYAALGMVHSARRWLEGVPVYASVYGPAQFLLVRLEQRNDLNDQARQRLGALMNHRATSLAAISELMALDRRRPGVAQLVRWADEGLNVDALPRALRFKWLWARVSMAADRWDWAGTLAWLEKIGQLDPAEPVVVTVRVAVMIQLKQIEQARRLYEATPHLATSKLGPLLALALGVEAAQVPDQAGMALFLQAMARGDFVAARQAAPRLKPQRTLYTTDLLATVDRPDAKSQAVARACVDLALAWVGIETGLEQLAVQISGDVATRLSDLVVAHGLWMHAQTSRFESNQKVWASVQQAVPDSSLGLFLSAQHHVAEQHFLDAAKDLEKLLAREPGHEPVRYQLAQLLQRTDRVDEATTLLQQIASSPGDYKIAAANDLAYWLVQRYPERLDEAYKLASQSLRDSPQLLPLLDTVGWIEYLRGQHPEALGHLSKAVVGLSYLPEVHSHLAAVYKAVGDDDWARYHLRQAADGAKNPVGVRKAKMLLAPSNGSAG